MRRSPALVPSANHTVHVVLDDFGKAGRAYRETDEAEADEATIVDNILTGQYRCPLRVVAFNTAEGWARDVSANIARKVLKRVRAEDKRIDHDARGFLLMHLGEEVEAADG